MVEMQRKTTTDEGHETIEPYYKIMADIAECPKCRIQLAINFAKEPVVEHWQEGYYLGVASMEVILT
jgi:hypothetical protein